jgi:hypothetical protein
MKPICALLFAFQLLVCVVLFPVSSRAEGALAVAQPPNVVKTGFAYGTAWNYATAEEARTEAMRRCRLTDSEARRALCKVIRTFNKECVAVAMDPKDGTPGVGWAIEASAEQAEAKAVAECRITAGASRRQFCKISDKIGCDTK